MEFINQLPDWAVPILSIMFLPFALAIAVNGLIKVFGVSALHGALEEVQEAIEDGAMTIEEATEVVTCLRKD